MQVNSGLGGRGILEDFVEFEILAKWYVRGGKKVKNLAVRGRILRFVREVAKISHGKWVK